MDNIIFKKVWQDGNLIELEINAKSEYIEARGNYYIQDSDLNFIAEKIYKYSYEFNQGFFAEISKKNGNYSPYFSMKFNTDITGHVKIEVYMEINDTTDRSHNSCFFINTTPGILENLAKSLKKLTTAEIGEKAFLYE